jgi:hypothetical protein
MKKKNISEFSCFAIFETFRFSNLNLFGNKFGIFVLQKFCETSSKIITKLVLLLIIRALHSELLTELSSRFSSRDEFSRVETSLEGSDITEIFPKFEFRFVPTLIFANRDEFGRLGHYRNISKIQKKSISETRENENFGKKRLTQGLTYNSGVSKLSPKTSVFN